MRNVKKYIEKALERGAFDDIEQCEIREAVQITKSRGLPTPFDYVSNGFLFGFECGYKEAKKEKAPV